MRRPGECLEEARLLLANRDAAHPAMVAMGDQLQAQVRDQLKGLRGVPDLPHSKSVEDETRAVAFLLAAQEALWDRLHEPSGEMCRHMIDLRIRHFADLTGGFVTCEECLPGFAETATPWAEYCCDVCGVEPENRHFLPITFALGAAVALAHVCDECSTFLGLA